MTEVVQTRPTSEQIRFSSTKTGEHILDTYLEAVERGNKTLAELVDEVWAADGSINDDFVQLRVQSGTLKIQLRSGQFLDPEEGWRDTGTYFIKARGAWSQGIQYNVMDTVEFNNGYYLCLESHVSTSTFSAQKFTALLNPATLNAAIANAQASRDAAAASQAAALSSQNAAATSASQASGSATNAANSATAAANSASAALASQNAAATSASSASSSATTATNKASEASASAGQANSSAAAAATSASTATARLNEFQASFLGRKTADPSVANDGSALVDGMMYWNTTSKRLRQYTGSMWNDVNAISGATNLAITGDLFFDTADAYTRYRGYALYVKSRDGDDTRLRLVPGDGKTASAFAALGSTDTSNAPTAVLRHSGTAAEVRSGRQGAGAFTPLDFYTSEVLRLRLDKDSGALISQGATNKNYAGFSAPGWAGLYAEQYTTQAPFTSSVAVSAGVSLYQPVVKTFGTITGVNSWAGSVGMLFNPDNIPSMTVHMIDSGGANNPAWQFKGDGTFLSGGAVNSNANLYNGVTLQSGRVIPAAVAGAMAAGAQTTNLLVQNPGGASSDANMAMMSFLCQGLYGIQMGLRPDGYFGLGGWSRGTWSWYTSPAGDMVAAGNVSAYSDPRLKEEITPIEGALKRIKRLDGVHFRWKQNSLIGRPGEYDYGVLADQVEEVAPEIVTLSVPDADGIRYRTVCYDKLVPFLIESIKELAARVEELERKSA